ncbi:MAG: acyl carrier protein [Eubacteriales bacterium]|nr:acyl carrier protein [Eubacteriales bacterium]
MDTCQKILTFFIEEKKISGITPDTDLFAGGYVNSLFALEMVLFLEKTFSIKIPRKEMRRENFTTVQRMADLVERVQG